MKIENKIRVDDNDRIKEKEKERGKEREKEVNYTGKLRREIHGRISLQDYAMLERFKNDDRDSVSTRLHNMIGFANMVYNLLEIMFDVNPQYQPNRFERKIIKSEFLRKLVHSHNMSEFLKFIKDNGFTEDELMVMFLACKEQLQNYVDLTPKSNSGSGK